MMKRRIAVWSGVGALVVVFWTLYMSATQSNSSGVVWALTCLTCPIALAHRSPLSFYLVLLVNAATYALFGAFVETMRRHDRIVRLVPN